MKERTKPAYLPGREARAVADQIGREADAAAWRALNEFHSDRYTIERADGPGRVYYRVSLRAPKRLLMALFVDRPATILLGGPDEIGADGVIIRPVSGPVGCWGVTYRAPGYEDECQKLYEQVSTAIVCSPAGTGGVQIEANQNEYVLLRDGLWVDLAGDQTLGPINPKDTARPQFRYGRVSYDDRGDPIKPKPNESAKDDFYAYWHECRRLRMNILRREVATLAGMTDGGFGNNYSRWLRKCRISTR